jgi:hypothetical protein
MGETPFNGSSLKHGNCSGEPDAIPLPCTAVLANAALCRPNRSRSLRSARHCRERAPHRQRAELRHRPTRPSETSRSMGIRPRCYPEYVRATAGRVGPLDRSSIDCPSFIRMRLGSTCLRDVIPHLPCCPIGAARFRPSDHAPAAAAMKMRALQVLGLANAATRSAAEIVMVPQARTEGLDGGLTRHGPRYGAGLAQDSRCSRQSTHCPSSGYRHVRLLAADGTNIEPFRRCLILSIVSVRWRTDGIPPRTRERL